MNHSCGHVTQVHCAIGVSQGGYSGCSRGLNCAHRGHRCMFLHCCRPNF